MNVPFSELKKPHKPFKCAFYYPPIPDGFVGELPEGVGQLYYKIGKHKALAIWDNTVKIQLNDPQRTWPVIQEPVYFRGDEIVQRTCVD